MNVWHSKEKPLLCRKPQFQIFGIPSKTIGIPQKKMSRTAPNAFRKFIKKIKKEIL